MEKIITTVTTVLTIFALNAQTAPPNAFNYSGVARNPNSTPIANQNIGVQFSVLKSNPTTGTVVYSENHFTTTDAFGLFNLSIGTGAVQSGNFANIDWSNDNYFLRVGIDPAGGTNFVTIGATQFLSVPYAIYAKSAGSVSGNSVNLNTVVPKFNGVSIYSPNINIVFAGSYGNTYYDFVTDSSYRFSLFYGQNYNPLPYATAWTDDTVSMTNVYFETNSSDAFDIGSFAKTIRGVDYRSNSYGSYYIPSSPSLASVPINLYRRTSNSWTLTTTTGRFFIKSFPNNSAVTGFNSTFPINLTIEKQ